MSEVQSRPSAVRGRGSHRGGRGGYGSRSSVRSGTKQANGEAADKLDIAALDEQGELGQLKKHYLGQLETLKELFPDWSDDDLVFALQETDGDLQSTIERITEGTVSRFADVKKKKAEKPKPRTKEFASTSTREAGTGSIRGSRGRGALESGRGGRSRGSDRGRGGARGGRGAALAAATATATPSTGDTTTSIPTTESESWGPSITENNAAASSAPWGEDAGTTNTNDQSTSAQWESVASSNVTPASASEGQKSSLIPEGTKKSWASMLAQPKPPPAVPKTLTTTQPSSKPLTEEKHAPQDVTALENIPPPPIDEEIVPDEKEVNTESEGETYANYELTANDELVVAPPKVPLTEDNVESLPDVSIPIATETVASTRDAQSTTGSLTPSVPAQATPSSRPPVGGFATSAWKATTLGGRSASFQRKMMDQREAVVMPGSHAVDRAAVQFGSMGLNGDNGPLDVDDEREAPETRTQPQHSPPSQPRTSLPPAPPPVPQQQQHMVAEQSGAPEAAPTPKPAPGLTATSQAQAAAMGLPAQAPLSSLGQSAQQMGQPYSGQYGRYGGTGFGHETQQLGQKAYDPFSQQLNYPQNQQDQQGLQGSQPQSTAPQSSGHSQAGGYSQASNEYSQYGSEQSKSSFQNYYGGAYGQSGMAAQQEQSAPPQRSGSGIGSNENAYSSSQPSQSRFGEHQNSGGNTPNPTGHQIQQQQQQQQLGAQSQHGQPIHQQQHHGQGAHGYQQYANPYYGGSYYGSYMNQYPQYNYNHQGYGAPYGGKGNMYGQPHHGYGLGPQTSYEHSSSPANAGGFGASSAPGRESGFPSGFGEFGRSGSAQASQGQHHGSSGAGFPGSASESYSGRSASGFSNDARVQYAQQQAEETSKSYGDKAGQSPAAPAQPGRSGSSNNSAGYGAHQSNFPPPQSQQGYGGYPGSMNQVHASQGSQYSHLGGLGQPQGNAQSQQAGGYGGYGAGFGSGYGSYGRGGWGGNSYGQH